MLWVPRGRQQYSRAMVRAVLFDVDFTLALPGPELGPEGYRKLGERHGLTLEPELYAPARQAALDSLQRHPELEHDDELWIAFTERIVRGMGGDATVALDVDCAIGSRAFGRTKPHPDIFRRALSLLEVGAQEAAMVGDSYEDDIEGARALGIRAFLLDRDGRNPGEPDRLDTLLALPAALGLAG